MASLTPTVPATQSQSSNPSQPLTKIGVSSKGLEAIISTLMSSGSVTVPRSIVGLQIYAVVQEKFEGYELSCKITQLAMIMTLKERLH